MAYTLTMFSALAEDQDWFSILTSGRLKLLVTSFPRDPASSGLYQHLYKYGAHKVTWNKYICIIK